VPSVNCKCRCTLHVNVHDDYFNKQQNPQRRWHKDRQQSTKHLRKLGSEVITINRFPWHFPKFPDISISVRQIGHPADHSQVYWLLRKRNDRNRSRRNTHSLALSVWMNIGHTLIATGDYDCNVHTTQSRRRPDLPTTDHYSKWSVDLDSPSSNRFDNWLAWTAGCIVRTNIQPVVQLFDNRLNVCLHDAAGCSTVCQTGWTIGCMWTAERWVAWIKDVEFIQPVEYTCIHDTAGCPTSCQTGWNLDCGLYRVCKHSTGCLNALTTGSLV